MGCRDAEFLSDFLEKAGGKQMLLILGSRDGNNSAVTII